jgi:phage terminase Nu1 subunit (DNA packaging protein)
VPSSRLTQKQVAELLGLSSRQVKNLVDAGMPTESKGGKIEYDGPACVRWYVEYKQRTERAAGGETKAQIAELEREERELRVRRLRLELAQEEARLLDAEYVEQQWAAVTQRVRARLLALPTYAAQMVDVRTLPEGQALGERMMTDVLTALSTLGEDPELDADEEPPAERDAAA